MAVKEPRQLQLPEMEEVSLSLEDIKEDVGLNGITQLLYDIRLEDIEDPRIRDLTVEIRELEREIMALLGLASEIPVEVE